MKKRINILYDIFGGKVNDADLILTYIQKHVPFVTALMQNKNPKFELSDSMAEELINLAIVFAAENVSSPRISTKLNTLSLES